jgi:hypothetical protein
MRPGPEASSIQNRARPALGYFLSLALQIAAKAAAGFKLYNQDYRGRSAERGDDLIGEVISL